VRLRRRLTVAAASLALAVSCVVGAQVATSAPASASLVYNMMKCDVDTGWCYQTNPPYRSAYKHECQWDHTLHNLHSGMWFTGCDVWWPDIY